MSMKWNDLKHKASPAKRARLQREAHAELERIGFDKLRLARKQTQVAVAAKLKVAQGAVSRMEKQSDFLLSTLREYVSALGGQLELRAIFPDGDFVIESMTTKGPTRKHRTRTKAAA
ncbi:MAG: hypothetical protein WCA37_10515 [Terracidiphilus sp.]